MTTLRKFSMLNAWLDRKQPLPSFIDMDGHPPNQEFGTFLSLDVAISAHESISLDAESLNSSWQKTHRYVSQALSLIDADGEAWLDGEEASEIREELGDPPPLCYPIYLISVGTDETERVVYIGKTSANRGRFRAGHVALTKLLNPKYDGETKRIYLGAIVLLADDKSYLPLEWVKPLEIAERLLASIEAQLIYWYKPELNTQNVHTNNSNWRTSIHIQNFSGVTNFLHDNFCWP